MTRPVTIRGTVYPTYAMAARSMGVLPTAITNAIRKGRLEAVGLKRTGKTPNNYDAQLDAEYILENIMHRKNWSVDVRDELQAHLQYVTRKAI